MIRYSESVVGHKQGFPSNARLLQGTEFTEKNLLDDFISLDVGIMVG